MQSAKQLMSEEGGAKGEMQKRSVGKPRPTCNTYASDRRARTALAASPTCNTYASDRHARTALAASPPIPRNTLTPHRVAPAALGAAQQRRQFRAEHPRQNQGPAEPFAAPHRFAADPHRKERGKDRFEREEQRRVGRGGVPLRHHL